MNIELHSVYNLYLHTQLVLYLKIHNSFQMLMYCLHSPVSLVFFLQPAKRNKKYDYVLKHLQFNNHDWHEWFLNWCKWLDNNKWRKQCTVKELFIVERMQLKLHIPSPDILVHCSLWDNFLGYPHCVVGNCPPSSIPTFGRSHRVILHIHDNKGEHTLWQVRSLRLFPVAPPTTPPSNAGPTGNLFYPVHRPCFVRWGSDAPRTHWI